MTVKMWSYCFQQSIASTYAQSRRKPESAVYHKKPSQQPGVSLQRNIFSSPPPPPPPECVRLWLVTMEKKEEASVPCTELCVTWKTCSHFSGKWVLFICLGKIFPKWSRKGGIFLYKTNVTNSRGIWNWGCCNFCLFLWESRGGGGRGQGSGDEEWAQVSPDFGEWGPRPLSS